MCCGSSMRKSIASTTCSRSAPQKLPRRGPLRSKRDELGLSGGEGAPQIVAEASCSEAQRVPENSRKQPASGGESDLFLGRRASRVLQLIGQTPAI